METIKKIKIKRYLQKEVFVLDTNNQIKEIKESFLNKNEFRKYRESQEELKILMEDLKLFYTSFVSSTFNDAVFQIKDNFLEVDDYFFKNKPKMSFRQINDEELETDDESSIQQVKNNESYKMMDFIINEFKVIDDESQAMIDLEVNAKLIKSKFVKNNNGKFLLKESYQKLTEYQKEEIAEWLTRFNNLSEEKKEAFENDADLFYKIINYSEEDLLTENNNDNNWQWFKDKALWIKDNSFTLIVWLIILFVAVIVYKNLIKPLFNNNYNRN